MLAGLSIRDVVLIEDLSLSFDRGLTVLTGETGAGKSILLDALALALGARADSGLVRHGSSQAMVAAEFLIADNPEAQGILAENGLDRDPQLIIRRTVAADGRSRSFVNDQPVSAGLLRRLAESLVEIHGQFEAHGLFDPRTHGMVLDAYAGLNTQRLALGAAWRAWRSAEADHAELIATAAATKTEEDFLRDAVTEMDRLDPKAGEEAALSDARQRLQHREKLLDALSTAQRELAGDRGSEMSLSLARRALERVADRAAGAFDSILSALDRAAIEVGEALASVDARAAALETEGQDLTAVDDRLFDLRRVARRHGVAPDDLPQLRASLAARLAGLEDCEGRIAASERQVAAQRAAYLRSAEGLSESRRAAAARLDEAVSQELAPLKLERAVFRTEIAALDPDQWGELGIDRIAFLVSTNPGQPPGPIAKIASGGELARFMLALKVVLSGASAVATLVFDEVDSGIGGATADAVGERLARLAESQQVLVVTHSPQVAARGTHHWQVRKVIRGARMATEVLRLGSEARREEIARMLSGAEVTQEARAAAQRLIERPAPGRLL